MIFEEPPGATPIDPDTIAGLKFKHTTTRGELDELEQANIEQGLRWISTRRGGDVLSQDFIRTLHQKLFGDVWDWAGDFRLRATIPGIEPYQIAVQLRVIYLLAKRRSIASRNATARRLKSTNHRAHRARLARYILGKNHSPSEGRFPLEHAAIKSVRP